MRMRSSSLPALFVALLTATLLAACGTTKTVTVVRAPTSAVTVHCTAQDWAAVCNQHAPTLSVPPTSFGVAATYGIDFAWSCPSPTYAAGLSYLDSSDRSKGWSSSCLSRWHAAGKRTADVWETAAARALSGYGGGRADAFSALSEEQRLGIPTSRPVYFAVDFDTSVYSSSSIRPYFEGVRSVLGSRTGVYGGKTTVAYVQDLAPWRWQTAAWSGGFWNVGAQLQQYAFSNAVDWDRSYVADYGQTPAPGPTIDAASFNEGFRTAYARSRSLPYLRGYLTSHHGFAPKSAHDYNFGYSVGLPVGHRFSVTAGTQSGRLAPKSPTTWGGSWSLGFDVGYATGVGNPFYRYFISTPHGRPSSDSAFNGGWKIGYPGGYNREYNAGWKAR